MMKTNLSGFGRSLELRYFPLFIERRMTLTAFLKEHFQ